MSGLVLISMTLIAYWLIIIARAKSSTSAENITEDNLDGIQNPSSPIAIHSTVESALWKSVQKARTPKGLSRESVSVSAKSKRLGSDPKNLNIATRGKFAIIGEDDSDEENREEPAPVLTPIVPSSGEHNDGTGEDQ